MHRDFDIAVFDVVLMVVGPPLLGTALGTLVSWGRSRPLAAALGGMTGGTIGAWVGLAIYRLAILPNGRDLLIFEALILGGVLVAAVPTAWFLAGQPRTTAARLHFAGIALAIAGVLLSCLGWVPYQMGSELSSFIPVSEETKDLGIMVLLVGLAVLVAGLLWVRTRDDDPTDKRG